MDRASLIFEGAKQARTDGGGAVLAVGGCKQAGGGAEEGGGLRQLPHARHRPAALDQAVRQRPGRHADGDRRHRRQQRHLHVQNTDKLQTFPPPKKSPHALYVPLVKGCGK